MKAQNAPGKLRRPTRVVSSNLVVLRRRAHKLFREIDRSVKLRKRMANTLGMNPETVAREMGDEIY